MAYTDLATMKAQFDITDSGQDTIIAVYVAAASARCDSYTGRIYGDDIGEGFEQHARTNDIFELDDVSKLNLIEWPVISIASISLDDEALVSGTDYRINLRTGVITFQDSSNYQQRVSGVLKVTHDVGFETIPGDVELGCLRLGAYWFNRKATEGLGSQLIGDLQESFRRPEEVAILHDTIGQYQLHSVG